MCVPLHDGHSSQQRVRRTSEGHCEVGILGDWDTLPGPSQMDVLSVHHAV